MKRMSQLRLFLFGPPRLERDDQAIEITLRKALALLIYLAVTRQAHSRDALATLLWPDNDQRNARASLRRALHQLNQALRQELVVTPETVALDPQADLWLDIETYQQHLSACLARPEAEAELSPECLSRLAEAVALYTDDFLAGFTLPDCPDFDEWQFFQTESLRQSLSQVLAQLAQAHQAQEEFDQAIAHTRRWLALDPLHEPAQRQLMQLYDQVGRPAAALRQYQAYTRLLEEELGLPPAEETTTLYEAIKAKQLLSPFVKAIEKQQGDRGAREQGKKHAERFTLAPPLPRFPAQTETRYVQSGDVHIAYQVFGEGPVDIVVIGGFVSHLEQIWEEPGYARFLQRLASFSRLILFDKRGVGLSDRIGYPPSLEHTMDDTRAVMDAAGSKRAVLFGVSQGGPNSVLFAATYPERVLALVIYGGLARWLRSPDYPWGMTLEQFDRTLGRYVTHWGGPIRLEYFAPSRAEDERLRQWWARLLRLASSPGGIRAVLEVTLEIDVRHILPAIRVPTLVLHRTGDKIIPVEAGRYMARQIPGATFVELPGQDHFWWVGDAEGVLAEIERFLQGLRQSPPPDRMLATILLAEISMPVLSEAKGKSEIAEVSEQEQALPAGYRTLVSQEIARFRGREIEQNDRHFLAIFDGPSRAIQCATTISALARAHGVAIRVGLHAGECEFTAGDLGGLAAQIVAGAMAQARPGEVLVTGTVKDLVAGVGFTFEERGTHALAGIAGEWPLFELKNNGEEDKAIQ